MKTGDEISIFSRLLKEYDVDALVPYAVIEAAWQQQSASGELDLRVAISVLTNVNTISAKYDDQRTALGIVRL